MRSHSEQLRMLLFVRYHFNVPSTSPIKVALEVEHPVMEATQARAMAYGQQSDPSSNLHAGARSIKKLIE